MRKTSTLEMPAAPSMSPCPKCMRPYTFDGYLGHLRGFHRQAKAQVKKPFGMTEAQARECDEFLARVRKS